jgi:hypothetical protein
VPARPRTRGARRRFPPARDVAAWVVRPGARVRVAGGLSAASDDDPGTRVLRGTPGAPVWITVLGDEEDA